MNPSPPQAAQRPWVGLDGPLVEARFLARPNRFIVEAALRRGSRVRAHLPDPGRLRELLLPGRRLWLRHAPHPDRKTSWTLVLVEAPHGNGLVSLDTNLPNRLIAEALRQGVLSELDGWTLRRTEVAWGSSRFDFELASNRGRLLLEVKSVTLVEAGVGLFPDAVTSRGARHVRELAAAVTTDDLQAAVLFVAQRSDLSAVRAAVEIDPDFAAGLREAREVGVRLLARRCQVGLERVVLGDPIPVE